MSRPTKREQGIVFPPTTCRELLAIVGGFLMDPTVDSAERGDAWDVLSALRGPDERERWPDKACTTSVIRAALLDPGGRLRGKGRIGQVIRWPRSVAVNGDSPEHARRRKLVPVGHFQRHAEEAFRVLGLRWNRSNGRR